MGFSCVGFHRLSLQVAIRSKTEPLKKCYHIPSSQGSRSRSGRCLLRILSLADSKFELLLVHLDGSHLCRYYLLYSLPRILLSPLQRLANSCPITQSKPSNESDHDHGSCLFGLFGLFPITRILDHLYDNEFCFGFHVWVPWLYLYKEQSTKHEKSSPLLITYTVKPGKHHDWISEAQVFYD